jgi:hypothetical protein
MEQLCEAVACWLEFQFLCGRETLLCESYISQPVGEFLLSSNKGHHLVSEYNHPTFANNDRGRPKQLDYVVLSRDSQYIELAIEAKYVGNSPLDKSKVFNDILRLERLRDTNIPTKSIERYFLVCGKKENFATNFQNVQFNNNGGRDAFFPKLLDFENKVNQVKKIQLNDNEYLLRMCKNFYEDYSVELPNSFESYHIGSFSTTHFLTMLWRIKSVRGSTTFQP